jgi:hypothetical protein
MTGLFAISMASGAGSALSSSPVQDLCTVGLCAAGFMLLAMAGVIVQRAPRKIKDRRG